ncbi:alpha/beta hydrolase [Streptomyces amakusaensis]|uniref:Alpha/beta fold hydrolase n=1 Tax=Streptomyces amakusaensis TaxID=67271 RepID=A0ABW0AVD0_9ACTN
MERPSFVHARHVAPLLAVSVIATLAPALATAPATAAPGVNAQHSPYLQHPQVHPKVTWQRCAADKPASLQCATIKVPLNHAKPEGGKIGIAVSRIRATDPAQRRGVLLFNPGGPGGSGLYFPSALTSLPASVKARYDLIGFDPRGIGESAPVACGLTPDEREVERPYKEETFAQDVARSRAFADKCRAKHKDSLRHITTRNTARDMDVIRKALGEKKINYLGYSYGTYLGAVYTQLFPRNTDRVVLDSAVDPKRVWRDDFQLWAPEAEKAFKRWTKWTAERSAEYRLGDTPAKVGKTFWDIVAQAEREPVVVGRTPLDGDRIRSLMRAPFFRAATAAELVVTLKKAAAGKPTPDLPDSGGWDDRSASALWTVTCGDANWPRNPETYRKDAIRDKARYPLFGDFASNISPCAFWDRTAEPTTKVDNKVRALIVQNEWDSQTPLPDAIGLREDMKGSRMILVDEGEGHGVYTTGLSECADTATTAYLTHGSFPAKDMTCLPTPAKERSGTAELPIPLPLPTR